jgi:SET domain-containing protein
MAQYANHSCNPNCEFNEDANQNIWLKTIKPILKGEEITVNYKWDFDINNLNQCRCGDKQCNGFIAKDFPTQNRRGRPTKKTKES